MLFINFKTYEQGTGSSALELIKIIEQVAFENQVKIIPVVQASDVREAVTLSKLEIWVQNIDSVDYGAHTGSILAEAVFEDGASGTFLNHSEHKFSDSEVLKKTNAHALSIGLKTLVFAADKNELIKIIEFNPTLVAYEPPELVGSLSTSVTLAEPDVIKSAAEIAIKNKIPLIVGAGIKSEEDVRTSLCLGASGVAVSSDVVIAKDPKTRLLNLISGIR